MYILIYICIYALSIYLQSEHIHTYSVDIHNISNISLWLSVSLSLSFSLSLSLYIYTNLYIYI